MKRLLSQSWGSLSKHSAATSRHAAVPARLCSSGHLSRPCCSSFLTLNRSFRSSVPKRSEADSPEQDVAETISNLLYNVPNRTGKKTRRVVTALVSNEPGVLARMSGILAARNFNIDSLVVSATHISSLSRITLVLTGDDEVKRAIQQLEDMMQVWAVVEYQSGDPIAERELVLVKLSTAKSTSYPMNPEFDVYNPVQAERHRVAVMELTKLFNGKIVDLASSSITVEVTAKQSRIDAFLKMLRPYGITEVSRSGVLAIVRGSERSLGEMDPTAVSDDEDEFKVDASMLPPG